MTQAMAITEETSTDHGMDDLPPEIVSGGSAISRTWETTDFPANGTLRTGIWACEPGKLTLPGYPYDETFTIISGKVEMIGDDGTVLVLGPGESGVIRKGWKGVWYTVESLRKVYTFIE